MRFLTLLLLAVPATVSACEGECIVGTTNAWLSNYTTPIETVMQSIATQISNLIPSHPSPDRTRAYLSPILTAYHDASYQNMETGIFPSFFHGKCLDDAGNVPAGCPNPDCPVVCGTPGSMVHFFPKLRYIAFNQTRHLLVSLASPGSPSYERMEQMVLAAADERPNEEKKRRRRRTRRFSRVFSRAALDAINIMQNDSNDDGDGLGSLVPVPVLGSSSGSGSSSSDSGPRFSGPRFPRPDSGFATSGTNPGVPTSDLDSSPDLISGVENAVDPSTLSGSSPISALSSGSSPLSALSASPVSSLSSPLSALPLSDMGSDALASALSRRKRKRAPNTQVRLPKRAQDIKAGLKSIWAQTSALLEEACGGSGSGDKNGLPQCSWERAMKAYILTFP